MGQRVHHPRTVAEVDGLPDRYRAIKAALARGLTPPDTMGAVGPHGIVEMINGGFAVYSRSGRRLAHSSLSAFWKRAGIERARARALIFDPVILFERFSERWFAVAADDSLKTRGPNARSNQVLLAVSKGPDPTRGWKAYSLAADPAGELWADQPTLGVNRHGLFLSLQMFKLGQSNPPPVSITLLALSKADLVREAPLRDVDVTRFTGLPREQTGFIVQPAITVGGTGPEVFLGDLANVGMPGRFKMMVLRGGIRSPTLDSTIAPIPVAPLPPPPPARQPGSDATIDTGNGLSYLAPSLVERGGSVWGVENVGRRGRVALRWFEIDARTGTLDQEGVLGRPRRDLYYGSIAVNRRRRALIGFTGSGAGTFPSSYASVGTTRHGRTRFGPPRLLKAGAAPYDYRPGGSARNRWGDYSAIVVDPSRARSFWTFQEFAMRKNRWGTRISRIRTGR